MTTRDSAERGRAYELSMTLARACSSSRRSQIRRGHGATSAVLEREQLDVHLRFADGRAHAMGSSL